MTTPRHTLYPLIFCLMGLLLDAHGIESVARQPIADLSAAIRQAGHERIAQGVQDVIAKDSKTGKVFNAKAPLMLTTNRSTGEWTISVLHDKVVGSTLLIGTGLKRPADGEVLRLKSFNRKAAERVMAACKGRNDPAYYPDEIARLQSEFGYKRVFTGKVSATTHPFFSEIKEADYFCDVLVKPGVGHFKILITDQSGACFKIAFGRGFEVKS